jgi:uncharacterized membrane protein HdeD (DUF308 family)
MSTDEDRISWTSQERHALAELEATLRARYPDLNRHLSGQRWGSWRTHVVIGLWAAVAGMALTLLAFTRSLAVAAVGIALNLGGLAFAVQAARRHSDYP